MSERWGALRQHEGGCATDVGHSDRGAGHGAVGGVIADVGGDDILAGRRNVHSPVAEVAARPEQAPTKCSAAIERP